MENENWNNPLEEKIKTPGETVENAKQEGVGEALENDAAQTKKDAEEALKNAKEKLGM